MSSSAHPMSLFVSQSTSCCSLSDTRLPVLMALIPSAKASDVEERLLGSALMELVVLAGADLAGRIRFMRQLGNTCICWEEEVIDIGRELGAVGEQLGQHPVAQMQTHQRRQ
eukprot:1156378-Pelagomonas_calceolata.AAC.5